MRIPFGGRLRRWHSARVRTNTISALRARGDEGNAIAGALSAYGDGATPQRSWEARIERRRGDLAASQDVIPRWGRPWLPDRTGFVPEGEPVSAEQRVAAVVGASKDPPWCRVLYELCRRLRPRHVVEMGTNLGISGAYIATALAESGSGQLTTLEGSPHKAAIARKTLEELELRNQVDFVVGDFRDTLEGVLERLGSAVDLAFIDGFHERDATIDFHERFVAATRPAVLVYDDIRWSKGMLDAWHHIEADPRIALSVDADLLGIVHVPADREATPPRLDWPPP